MEKCTKCKINYPDGFLSPVIMTGITTRAICGICALSIINKIHGDDRVKFNGEIAESLRLQAVEFRKEKNL